MTMSGTYLLDLADNLAHLASEFIEIPLRNTGLQCRSDVIECFYEAADSDHNPP